MKILHVLNTGKFSGAENVVCQIIAMYRSEPDIEMVYCSLEGLIRGTLEEKCISFTPVEQLCPKELKRVINEQKPDLIHAHDMRAAFVVSQVNKDIPFVCHIHNNAYDSRRITPKAIAFLFAAMRSKHTFWVSDSAMNGYVFRKLIQKKSSILYNILDITELIQKVNKDPNSYDYDIVYLGRLSKEKNPLRFVNIMKEVIDRCPSATLGVIGNGSLENNIRDCISEYGLENNIIMLGFQQNPLKILEDSKVMIMTSLWEGLPMCALEALALGVPIVSTPTDGLKVLVKDNCSGFLSDNDDVLAEAIVNILNDCELQIRLSKYAKEHSKSFNDINRYKCALNNAYRGIEK